MLVEKTQTAALNARLLAHMDKCVEALNAIELAEGGVTSAEDFLKQAQALRALLEHASFLVRRAEPGADLSQLFLYVGTGLPEACRRAAMQANPEGESARATYWCKLIPGRKPSRLSSAPH